MTLMLQLAPIKVRHGKRWSTCVDRRLTDERQFFNRHRPHLLVSYVCHSLRSNLYALIDYVGLSQSWHRAKYQIVTDRLRGVSRILALIQNPIGFVGILCAGLARGICHDDFF
jgi:hypothetical protein